MPRLIRRVLLILGIILVIIILLMVALLIGPSTPPTTLPNPNGYDDFVKAGSLIVGEPGAYRDFDADALRNLVHTNSEPLRLVREGLTRDCLAPTDLLITNFSAALPTLTGHKRLGQLLAAEGRLAENEGRKADAAQSYVDAIQLGNQISRGGLLIDRLSGIAIERLGHARLIKLALELSPDESKPVVNRLEKINRSYITWNEVIQAETRFARYHARKMAMNPLALARSWWVSHAAIKKAKERHQKLSAQVTLLTLELALHCYRTEHGGGPPGSLEQVTQRQPLPVDPFSGQALVYRPQGTNWLLYSVGPNGVDDGGTRTGDLFFDSP